MNLTDEEKKIVLGEIMRELGRKGGEATKKKHGKRHFRKIRKLVHTPKRAT